MFPCPYDSPLSIEPGHSPKQIRMMFPHDFLREFLLQRLDGLPRFGNLGIVFRKKVRFRRTVFSDGSFHSIKGLEEGRIEKNAFFVRDGRFSQCLLPQRNIRRSAQRQIGPVSAQGFAFAPSLFKGLKSDAPGVFFSLLLDRKSVV